MEHDEKNHGFSTVAPKQSTSISFVILILALCEGKINENKIENFNKEVKDLILFLSNNKFENTRYYGDSDSNPSSNSTTGACINIHGFENLHISHNYIKQNNKYQKNESKISFSDIEECLVLVVSSFSKTSITSGRFFEDIPRSFL